MSAPDPSSPHLNNSDHFLPPDPLLQSGFFIDPTAPTDGESLSDGGAEMPTTDELGASTPIHGRSSGRAAAKSSSDGGELATATKDGGSERKRQRRVIVGERRAGPGETPDWLPPGWIVKDRVRSSGATAGTVDKYYCDPVSGHVFRSRKEVVYFLETGTKRKKTADSSDADTAAGAGESSGRNRRVSGSAVLKPPPNFDFSDPPEKVTWVLTDSSVGLWAPSMDGNKLPESTVREWDLAFKYASPKKR